MCILRRLKMKKRISGDQTGTISIGDQSGTFSGDQDGT